MSNSVLPKTERPSEAHTSLDTYDTETMVITFVDDQVHAVEAVRQAASDLARAIDAAVPRIARGGRLIYVGAGTSGRLGLLDSVELLPTFSWDPQRAIALLAGGGEAIFRAVEGAEDSREQGVRDVEEVAASEIDVLLAVAASGSTPYVLGAIEAAKRANTLCIGFANNIDSLVTSAADIGVTLDTGTEVISGSTRLKAGTAQKIALNTFSSSLMVQLNKVYGNLMVDLKPTNAKLMRRCVNLTMLATGCHETVARETLDRCSFHVKTAIIMIEKKLDAASARTILDRVDGSVRRALSRI